MPKLSTSPPQPGTTYPWLQVNPVGSYKSADIKQAVVVPEWFKASIDAPDAELKRKFRAAGWRDPQMLFGYTLHSEWKDLYVFFDHGDTKSEVNKVATQAFRMYGLNGRQDTIDWKVIRGPVVLCRADPPSFPVNPFMALMGARGAGMGPADRPFPPKPDPTVEEVVQALAYFQGKDAREVAQKRDHHRLLLLMMHQKTQGAAGKERFPPGLGDEPPDHLYVGTDARFRSARRLQRERDACAWCGVKRYLNDLQRCKLCMQALYCSPECQRKDWKEGHRHTCARENFKPEDTKPSSAVEVKKQERGRPPLASLKNRRTTSKALENAKRPSVLASLSPRVLFLLVTLAVLLLGLLPVVGLSFLLQ